MRQLTEFDLALKEDDEYLVLQGRQILRRVLNVARYELEQLHLKAQTKGEVVRATGDLAMLEKLLLDAAKKELKPATLSKKQITKALEAGDKLRAGQKASV